MSLSFENQLHFDEKGTVFQKILFGPLSYIVTLETQCHLLW